MARFVEINYHFPVNYFDGLYIVNKKAFERLGADTQASIRALVAKMAPATTKGLFSEEDELGKAFAEAGMKIVEPEQKDIDKATALIEPYWAQWAQQQGPEVVEALAKVRAMLNR